MLLCRCCQVTAADLMFVYESFPFVCLDFDSIEFLFCHENTKLVKFLLYLKEKNNLILSSPVDEGAYRFKIFFQVDGFNNFKDFKLYVENHLKEYKIGYEGEVSLAGCHFSNISLKPSININEWPLITVDDLDNIFGEGEHINKNFTEYFKKYENLSYADLLTNLFCSEFYLSDQIFNKVAQKAKSTQKFYKCLNTIPEECFGLVNEVHNNLSSISKHDLTLENAFTKKMSSNNLSSSLENVKLSRDDVIEKRENEMDIFENCDNEETFKQKLIEILENNKEKEKVYIKNGENKNFNLSDLDLEKLNEFFVFMNKNFGFQFNTIEDLSEHYKEENNSYHFSSSCIFKTDDLDNRVTQLFVSKNKVVFYCHHESCQSEKKYANIENEINSMFLTDTHERENRLFSQQPETIREILKKILLNDFD